MLAKPRSQPLTTELADTHSGNPVVVRVRGIHKAFGGNEVLKGVDLDLHAGEVVLLRGDNGSGKTTLLNILTGNLEPDAGEIRYAIDDSPHTYRFPRRWWQELNPMDHFRPEFVAREGVGRTWQDVRLFPSLPLRDNIAVAKGAQTGENPIFALLTPGRSRKANATVAAEADALLARLGLGGREFSSGDMVSLGQSKRVAIARAIAAGASVLFLDEPLAGLDRRGIADILAMLEALMHERRLTLVIVEHVFNQPHLHGLITTNWLLRDGKLHRNGVAHSRRRHEGHGNASDSTTRPEWFTLLAGDNAEIIDEPLPRGAMLTRIRQPDRYSPNARPILEIGDLVVNRGSRPVVGLDIHGEPVGLSFTLYEGEVAILQAPNGWGKSTLFAAIAGLIPVASGVICLKGQILDGQPVWKRVRAGLRMLPSDRHTFPSLTGRESLDLAGVVSAPENLTDLIERPLATLSGGQKQRLALASMQPGLLDVYDEPISALDSPEPFLRLCNGQAPQLRTSLVLVPSATDRTTKEHP